MGLLAPSLEIYMIIFLSFSACRASTVIQFQSLFYEFALPKKKKKSEIERERERELKADDYDF